MREGSFDFANFVICNSENTHDMTHTKRKRMHKMFIGKITWFLFSLDLRLMNTQNQIRWGKLFADVSYFRYTLDHAESSRTTVDKFIWQKPVSIINHLQTVSINYINMHSSTIQYEIQPPARPNKCRPHHFRLFHVGASESIISHRNFPNLLIHVLIHWTCCSDVIY